MPLLALIGCQWGDEGKGKVVDMLSAQSDLVARFQGGNNAGHTVVIGDKTIILHTIPTGILHPRTKCLIGNGVVIDPEAFAKEVEELEANGYEVQSKLTISENAHLIMPYHKLLDKVQEKMRGKGRIGTTGRGIGSAYGDKALRQGVRVLDLRDKDRLAQKVTGALRFYEPIFKFYNSTVDDSQEEIAVTAEEVIGRVWQHAPLLTSLAVDGVNLINDYLDKGKKVLCEGAQGIHLDLDFGTYPYVTSSNPSPGGICTGLGISPKRIDRIVGVVKAYTTRVGEGPLPTELKAEEGKMLRELGAEYGATTGRPRRCGWFDAPLVRRALQISGATEICLTKLDVLDSFPRLKICTAYRTNGEQVELMPFGIDSYSNCQPVYEEVPGWQRSTQAVTDFDLLPAPAKAYIKQLEKLLNVKVILVSVGAARHKAIVRTTNWFQ